MILYSDFNCPFCYALEHRLAALSVELGLEVEWRGVEHSPWLRSPIEPADPALAAELDREAQALAVLAPELPLVKPAGKPNTRVAILAAAAAIESDPAAGRRFKAALYEAFWRDGHDLGDPAVLGELAAGAGISLPEPTAEVEKRVGEWRAAWEATGLMAVPLLVARDGRLLPGLVGADELRAFALPA